jgi:hypothetical protein
MKLSALGEYGESHKFELISADIRPKQKKLEILNLHTILSRLGW